MKVILAKDIQGTGKAGEIIEVSEGYARNFILPKKLGVIATPEAIEQHNYRVAKRKEEERAKKEEAQKLAEKLSKLTVMIEAKAGTTGKLYGTVTTKEVADELSKQSGVAIDKKMLQGDHIKEAGVHNFDLKLHTEVHAKIKVMVKPIPA